MSRREPDDFLDAEENTKLGFDLCFGKVGIAVGVDDAGACGEEGAVAVDFYGAAFEDDGRGNAL